MKREELRTKTAGCKVTESEHAALEEAAARAGLTLSDWCREALTTAAWVRKYLDESRPQLATEPDDKIVFLSNAGEPFSLDYLTEMVRGYVEAANLGKHGACHLFRHTMATLMLEGGADTRFIQAMLGHADLKTTQLYTHVAIRQLQDIHRATHPAKLAKKKEPES